MDCCYKPIPIVVKSQTRVFKGFSNLGFSQISSQKALKGGGVSSQWINRGNRRGQLRVVAAAASADSSSLSGVGTPLEPRSSAGKFLSDILQNHRHVFHFAVGQQLDELVSDRDGAIARDEQSSGSSESCLHRRIAEMKENECRIAVEDVMYMSIVHKFSEMKVPMVPKVSKCITDGKLQIWPSTEKELESVHSLEVQELIKEHLHTILSWRVRTSSTDNWTTNQIPRLQLGRIYAASIMYGYFLRSARLRHRLESSLALTHEDLPHLGHGAYASVAELFPHGSKNIALLDQSMGTRSTSLCQESRGGKAEKLKNYIMNFESETLQRCAKLRSVEAVNLIEKHTWALFGDENSGDIEIDEVINITNSSMKRLVLEAAAFGSFLWDVEEYVNSVYKLKEN